MDYDDKELKNIEKKTNEKYLEILKWKNNRFMWLTLIFLSFFILIYFVVLFLFVPTLNLIGSSSIVLDLNHDYVEKGASAFLGGKNISKNIKITGHIDTTKVGSYDVKYSVGGSRIKINKVRKVSVLDRIEPTITLVGGNEYSKCPNKDYVEPGYSAEDNYDGDLTNSVKEVIKDSSITYIVKDKSGNEAKISRRILSEDKEKPVITLKGSSSTYTEIGIKYSDPGATATDNCDGDLTNSIVVTNNVDTSKEGKYNIIYSVKDSSGNETIVERVVYVNKVNSVNPGIPGVIYLTFDDGPSATITAGVLDILKKYDIKATFFVVNHSDKLDYLIKREYDEGHTVAIHSYTHRYDLIYSSTDAFFNDLNMISDKVERITGEKSMIMRFPGGTSNTTSKKYSSGIMTTLTQEVLNRGYHYFDWNVSSGDAENSKTKEEVYNMVISNLSKKRANVVLMHDYENNYKTLNALESIIIKALADGYRFEAIDMSTPMVKHRVNN